MFGTRKSSIITFSVLSALFIGVLCYVYIPEGLMLRQLSIITLRQLTTDSPKYYLYLGDSVQPEVTMIPDTAVAELFWSSDEQSGVSVDEDGVITGDAPGQTDVTVSGDNGVCTSVHVTVIRKPLPSGSDLPPLYYEPIRIANVNNPLPADYVPETVALPSKYPASRTMKMTPETLDAYIAMYNGAKESTGKGFVFLSGYRSYQKQQSLFDEDVASFRAMGYSEQQAKEQTMRTTQLPGCSEHQLGQSVDIGTGYSLSNGFTSTKTGHWVTENCWRYGFILRYPADKIDKTGIDHEAWHFRYVGVEHAKYIYEHKLCLEEYVELQQEAARLAEETAQNTPASAVVLGH